LLVRVERENIPGHRVRVGRVKSFLFDRRKAQRGIELRGAALQSEAAQESPINMQGIGQGKNEFELGLATPAFDETYRFGGNGTGRTDLRLGFSRCLPARRQESAKSDGWVHRTVPPGMDVVKNVSHLTISHQRFILLPAAFVPLSHVILFAYAAPG
jgi:hypothetical protein